MSCSLWYWSSLEAKNPYPEVFRSDRAKVPLPKASIKAIRKDEFQNCSYNAEKMLVASSSHLVPEGLQDKSKSKKKWGEMNVKRKMEYVRTLLIDNYDSYTFNIYQELSVINKGIPLSMLSSLWLTLYFILLYDI